MGLSVPPGARAIGERPQVTITDIRIIEPASLSFQKGGCDRPNAVLRAEAVDIVHGMVWMLPCNIQSAERLYRQLGDLIAEHNKAKLEA